MRGKITSSGKVCESCRKESEVEFIILRWYWVIAAALVMVPALMHLPAPERKCGRARTKELTAIRRRANILIGTWSSNANLLLQSVGQNPR